MEIRETQPDTPELAGLMDRHLRLMRESSPACSVHAMDARRLAEAKAKFFAVYVSGEPVGMGALKQLSGAHGELKSMHVADTHRGQGVARALLEHLLGVARNGGLTRVSLETGTQSPFEPARAFYQSAGFKLCAPFEGYVEDPASVFMTLELS